MKFLEIGILIPVLGLAGLSLAVLGSTAPYLFANQLIFFGLGLFFYFLFALLDVNFFSKYFWFIYGLSLLFLLGSFFGPNVRGSTRWLDVGIRWQPSEVIKPFIIALLSIFLVEERSRNFSSLIKSFLLLFPVILLIFKQPDLGNVLVYLFTFISLQIASGLPWIYLLSGLTVSGILLPALWTILHQYQKNRIFAFLNPRTDPGGVGYNAIQAIIAIGSGQLLGLGLGKGTQSHLLFLPEYSTDFIFASLGEELGFFGGALVILFYLFLLGKLLALALNEKNEFGRLFCLGSFAQIFIQVLINIGMNLGITPITGITLPLVSYGGSSIIGSFITLGIVTSIAKSQKFTNPIVIR